MREIKFRAWHAEAEEYCDGTTANMFSWLQDGQSVILEQYTGLKDCERVEIYEVILSRCHTDIPELMRLCGSSLTLAADGGSVAMTQQPILALSVA